MANVSTIVNCKRDESPNHATSKMKHFLTISVNVENFKNAQKNYE